MNGRNTGNGQQQVLAAELRRVRAAAALSQEEMAARLGMGYAPGGRRVSTGRAAVSAWETGRRMPPAAQLAKYVELGADSAIVMGTATAVPPQPAAADGSGRSWLNGHRGMLVGLVCAVLAVAALVTTVTMATSTGHRRVSRTWTETTGTPAHTWADATQLTGAGTPLGPRESVQVSCRVRGYVVQDGDPWWYRIESAPWNGKYYATSDAFYNNGAISGSVITGVVVDEQVPICGK